MNIKTQSNFIFTHDFTYVNHDNIHKVPTLPTYRYDNLSENDLLSHFDQYSPCCVFNLNTNRYIIIMAQILILTTTQSPIEYKYYVPNSIFNTNQKTKHNIPIINSIDHKYINKHYTKYQTILEPFLNAIDPHFSYTNIMEKL